MIEEGKPAPTLSVPEAELRKTEVGLVVDSEGWFVVNARDVSWIRSEERGQDTDFEGRQEWTDLGFRIQIPRPVSAGCTTASGARRTSSSSPASVCS